MIEGGEGPALHRERMVILASEDVGQRRPAGPARRDGGGPRRSITSGCPRPRTHSPRRRSICLSRRSRTPRTPRSRRRAATCASSGPPGRRPRCCRRLRRREDDGPRGGLRLPARRPGAIRAGFCRRRWGHPCFRGRARRVEPGCPRAETIRGTRRGDDRFFRDGGDLARRRGALHGTHSLRHPVRSAALRDRDGTESPRHARRGGRGLEVRAERCAASTARAGVVARVGGAHHRLAGGGFR
jgi:hypothetical protein